MSDYVDLSALAGGGEQLATPPETEDYTPNPLTKVGEYISHSRVVKGREKDGFTTFEFTFVGGVQDPNSGTLHNNGKYPLKSWASNRPFAEEGRPGTTSTIAKYLRAVGFNPKGMAYEQLVEAVMESQTIPVKVFVGRTDRSVKKEDGTYEGGNTLKTRDFLLEDGTYAERVTINGVTYQGKEKIAGFSKL